MTSFFEIIEGIEMRANRLTRFLIEKAYFIRRKLIELFKLCGRNKGGGNHQIIQAVFWGKVKEGMAVAVVHHGEAVGREIILRTIDNVHAFPFFHERNFNTIVEVE